MKLQGRSSEKGEAEGRKERMDMMVPEMLCERWPDVSLIARKEETVAFWYTKEVYTTVWYTVGSTQLLSSHPDLLPAVST